MTTYVTRARGRRGLGPALALPLSLVLLTAACSGDSDEETDDDPASVLAGARAALDETSGVTVSLTTEKLPEGVDGVLAATGVGTTAPAFEGDITVVVNSITVDVPVVAVDGDVFAKLPFTKNFVSIDAEDYGAPDPADLLNTDGGVSSWLTAVKDVSVGDEVRDGDRVLTSYAGTLPGDAVDSVIPSADEKARIPGDLHPRRRRPTRGRRRERTVLRQRGRGRLPARGLRLRHGEGRSRLRDPRVMSVAGRDGPRPHEPGAARAGLDRRRVRRRRHLRRRARSARHDGCGRPLGRRAAEGRPHRVRLPAGLRRRAAADRAHRRRPRPGAGPGGVPAGLRASAPW